MWTFAFMERLVTWSNAALPILADLLLYSTVIGGVGLCGSHVLRRKGVVYQSLFLRLSLLAILLTPPTAAILSVYGVKGIHISLVRIEKPDIRGKSLRNLQPAVPEKQLPASHSLPPGQPALIPNGKPDKREIPRSTDHRSSPAGNALSPSPPALPSSPSPDRTVSSPVTSGGMPQKDIRIEWRYVLFPLGLALVPLIWISLSLFLLGRTLVHGVFIQYLISTARPAQPSHLAVCASIAHTLGMKPPRVLQSPRVRRAFLAGFFRPAIVLPLDPEVHAMSSREVFLHEFAHLIRRDHLWNLVCQIGKVIFPLQPLVWFLTRQIEITGEYACDDFVVVHGESGRGYARQLYTMALQFRTDRGEIHAGVGIFSVRSYLFQRIDRILDSSHVRRLKMKLHETLSFVVLFLSSVVLSGLFSFRSEAVRRGGMDGGPRFQENQSALNPEKKPAPGSRVFRVKRDYSIIDAVAENHRLPEPERTLPLPENENPADGTESAEPHEESDCVTLPNALLASLQVTREAGVEQVDSDDTFPQVTPAETLSLSLSSVPAEDIPDSRNTAARKTGKENSKIADGDSLPPDWLELRNASAIHGELIDARAGALKVEIPETAKEVLRESLEQGLENPVWSPVGNIIAFTGSQGRGIWTVPVNGGKPTLRCDNTRGLSSRADEEKGLSRTLCFSPDGSELAFVNYAFENQKAGAANDAASRELSPEPVIESVNLSTGARRIIAEGATDGSWNRDGRYFVYTEGDSRGIGILDISTGKRRMISETGHSPCLTSDGLSIIFVDQGWSDLFYQLYRAPIAGGKPEQLTTDGNWWKPEISPDGEWVMCTGYGVSRYSHSAVLRVFSLREHMSYYIRVDGAETAEMGAWSPTGRQFCYTGSIGMMNNGTAARRSAIYIENFQRSNLNDTASEKSQLREFGLVGNYPNPFNPSTTIRFSLPSSGSAELIIYNMVGQKVRELVSGYLEAGMHSIVWNGRDQQNKPVSSGVYVARLKMEGKVETHRMTLVK